MMKVSEESNIGGRVNVVLCRERKRVGFVRDVYIKRAELNLKERIRHILDQL